jgi:Dyp-type peroxidase family
MAGTPAMSTNPAPLDTDDIQGNVLAGFNTTHQGFLTATAGDLVAAGDAAAGLADLVTSCDSVWTHRNAARGGGEPLGPTGQAWVAVAVSHRLITTRHPEVRFGDPLLRQPMSETSPGALGDPPPTDWVVGDPDGPVDVAAICAAADADVVAATAAAIRSTMEAADMKVRFEAAARLPGEREHFGFRDGIAQPWIDARRDDGSPVSGGVATNGPPVAPSALLWGPPPLADPGNDPVGVAVNGSAVVLRRLVQDVDVFHAFCDDTAKQVTAGTGVAVSAEWVAAALVGRWPSGAVFDASAAADPGVAGDPPDDFDFNDADSGTRCPLGAHIRKVDPRGGVADVGTIPRILRRGIPFGSPYPAPTDAGRGLWFVAYQSSPTNQFAFLQTHWANADGLPATGPTAGHDPLIGQTRTPRTFRLPVPGHDQAFQMQTDRSWVTMTGGAYLITPGRRALAALAR